MEAGDTFKFGKLTHLWVVVSDTSIDSDRVLIINMTTDRGVDDSCVLLPGDHDLIKHSTCMRYDKSRIVSNKDLEKLINMGSITIYSKISAEILKRIRQGAARSKYIPLECKQVLVDQQLIEF
jgi:hypothetical protein